MTAFILPVSFGRSVRRLPRVGWRGQCVCVARVGSGGAVAGGAEGVVSESLRLLEWGSVSERVASYASTLYGKRELLGRDGWLKVPEDREGSEILLEETRECYSLEYVHGKGIVFGGITAGTEEEDVVTVVVMAAKGRVASGKELVNVAALLKSARAVRRGIDAVCATGVELPRLSAMVDAFRTWPEVERSIRDTVDEFGDVMDSADPELSGIRRGLKDTLTEIRAKLNDIMARHSDAIQERVITTRYDRFVIPVKMARKSEFRRGTVHDASATGSTAYIEPATVRPLNDKLRQLAAREKSRVNAVLRKLSCEVVAQTADDVRHLVDVLGRIDAASARARCSYSLDAVDVEFDDKRPMHLMGARHPLLSWNAMSVAADRDRTEEIVGRVAETTAGNENAVYRGGSKQMRRRVAVFEMPEEPEWKKAVVPSNYVLGEDVRCVCVTGPNTGGKTISLKTLGVCVLMAKAGLFVPAMSPRTSALLGGAHHGENELEAMESARVPYFDQVLVDIGDDQSLVQSLSTFSGHVERIKRILAATTSSSLCLFDEIGSGTDPAEGAALGMAILRHLAIGGRAALTFATTHHGELKTLKYGEGDTARFFENASVEFDDVRMAPTYRLIWGIPGRSNALAIASRLGLRESVIDEARGLLSSGLADGVSGSSRIDIEKMIAGLEREKLAVEEAHHASERARVEVVGLRTELRERLERLRSSESNLREEQREAMNIELADAKKRIAKVIREMQQGGGSAQAAGVASERLGKISVPNFGAASNGIRRSSDGSRGGEEGEGVNVSAIEVGDVVSVPRYGSSLEVVEVGGRKEIMVAIGSMKAKVKLSEVLSVTRPHVVQTNHGRASRHENGSEASSKRLAVRTAANTVDVRGQRVGAAEAKLDLAIDKGIAIGTVWIIHGHGSGRLRSGVRDYLSQHAVVERFEDAEQADGGTGVTIAYLR